MEKPNQSIRAIVERIYDAVGELEELYPGRPFTPDGLMVGSIGEVVAAERYGLELFTPGYPTHDGVAPDGRLVQVKATQGSSIGINEEPNFLIVLSLDRGCAFEEIYNGPGKRVWENASVRTGYKQRQISVARLRSLNAEVSDVDRIPVVL